MQRTSPPDVAKQHRLSLELAIRALQEQARLISHHRVDGADFSDAERVSLLISEAADRLGRASDFLRIYCPDAELYKRPTLTDRLAVIIKMITGRLS